MMRSPRLHCLLTQHILYNSWLLSVAAMVGLDALAPKTCPLLALTTISTPSHPAKRPTSRLNLQLPRTPVLFWSGFTNDQGLCCSCWRASAHVGGPNRLTSSGIYQ